MSAPPTGDDVAPPPISVQTVTSNLARYDGHEVVVKGVLTIQRENHSIADVVCEEDGKAALWIVSIMAPSARANETCLASTTGSPLSPESSIGNEEATSAYSPLRSRFGG